MAAGTWPRTALSNGREIAGKTLGVVGFGNIGRLTARLGRELGMNDRRVTIRDSLRSVPVWAEEGTENRSLDELLAAADVVTLHVPLVAGRDTSLALRASRR